MTTIWTWLQGKKSYIVALVAILYAITQFWLGGMSQQELIGAILAALGLSALRSGIGSAAKALLVGLALSLMVGCANQAAQLQPQIIAGDAAAISGKALLAGGALSVPSAKKLAIDLHVLDAGFKAALSSIDLNQPPAATVTAQLLASLDAIARDLQTSSKAQGIKKSLSPIAAIQLIDLIVQLTPSVINEFNLLFSGSSITSADCHTALAKFEADLALLDAALNTTLTPVSVDK